MINPHDWRKFEQAQRNMLKSLNMTRHAQVPEAKCWNGNNTPRKRLKRCRYWARQMNRWTKFI